MCITDTTELNTCANLTINIKDTTEILQFTSNKTVINVVDDTEGPVNLFTISLVNQTLMHIHFHMTEESNMFSVDELRGNVPVRLQF